MKPGDILNGTFMEDDPVFTTEKEVFVTEGRRPSEESPDDIQVTIEYTDYYTKQYRLYHQAGITYAVYFKNCVILNEGNNPDFISFGSFNRYLYTRDTQGYTDFLIGNTSANTSYTFSIDVLEDETTTINPGETYQGMISYNDKFHYPDFSFSDFYFLSLESGYTYTLILTTPDIVRLRYKLPGGTMKNGPVCDDTQAVTFSYDAEAMGTITFEITTIRDYADSDGNDQGSVIDSDPSVIMETAPIETLNSSSGNEIAYIDMDTVTSEMTDAFIVVSSDDIISFGQRYIFYVEKKVTENEN